MDKAPFSREYALFLKVLKDVRIEFGVTQEQLAASLNETQSFVSKCERGERRLDVIELRQFCDAIGIPFTEFAARLDDLLTRELYP
jgi:transcriptional regulator with XRE-family HTH domain